MPWVKTKLRFEFSIEELNRLMGFGWARGNNFDDFDRELLRKLSNCISQIEALEEKQKFREPCRFGGFCREEKFYNDCVNDERMRNNWMCWRDGILEDSQSLATIARDKNED